MSFFDEEKQIIPLITCENDHYKFHADTIDWLSTCDVPICPISCAGRYRTGKSFLLNRLSGADSNCGFGVGDSIQACTKGLWVYKQFFDGPNDTKIIFIDTEGIDALDANDTHDVRIFTLALLLSSTFLYNSVGAIDETALQTLNLMTRVVNNIKVSNDESRQDLSPHMPHFFWILRDFSLRLTDKQNNPITCDEYLENALQSGDKNKCHIRDAIRNAFLKRKLITLPRPTNDDNNINRLETRLMSMTTKFKDSLDDFKKQLFDKVTPIQANNISLNGNSYVELIKYYTQIITTDAVPVIQDSWALLAAVHSRDLKDRLVSSMEVYLSDLHFFEGRESLNETINSKINELVMDFDRSCMKPCDTGLKTQLVDRLELLRDRHLKNIHEKVAQMVREKLSTVEHISCKEPMQFLDTLKSFRASLTHCEKEILCMIDSKLLDQLCNVWLVELLQASESSAMECVKLREQVERKEMDFKDALEVKTRDFDMEKERLQLSYASLQEENNSLLTEKELLEEKLTEVPKTQHACEVQDIESGKDNVLVSELEEELNAWKHQRLTFESEIASGKDALERLQTKNAELLEERETTLLTHRQLETNWNSGIEKLENEARIASEQLRAELTAEIHKNKTLQDEFKRELMEQQNKAVENEKLYDQKIRLMQDAHESEVQNNKEFIKKGREQAESLSSKVMEVHNTMMSDIRSSNEKMRENQTKYNKSQMEMQSRYTEIIKENEQNKTENKHLKRRIGDVEECEKEFKRIKGLNQDAELNITRLNTEITLLRQYFTEANDEKEKLRKENMRLYGELSILNADRKLQQAREKIENSNLISL